MKFHCTILAVLLLLLLLMLGIKFFIHLFIDISLADEIKSRGKTGIKLLIIVS